MRDLNFIDTFNNLITYFEHYNNENTYLNDIFLKIFNILEFLNNIYIRDCSSEWRKLKKVFETNEFVNKVKFKVYILLIYLLFYMKLFLHKMKFKSLTMDVFQQYWLICLTR